MNKIFSSHLIALALSAALLPSIASSTEIKQQAIVTASDADLSAYTSKIEQMVPLLQSSIMMRSLTKSLSTDPDKQQLIGSKLSATLDDSSFQKAFVTKLATILKNNNTSTSYTDLLKKANKQWPKALLSLFNGGVSRLNDDELKTLFGAISNSVNRWDDKSCSLIISGKSNSSLRRQMIDKIDINDVRNILDVALQAMKYEAKQQPEAKSMNASDLKKANSILMKVVAKWAIEDPITATQTLNLIKNANNGGEVDPLVVCKASRQLLSKTNEVSGTEGALLRRFIVHTYIMQLQLK